jgi:integrase
VRNKYHVTRCAGVSALRCGKLSVRMPGRRALNEIEQHALHAALLSLPPRDRALVCTQWFTGARISEVLKLRVRDVLREGAIVSQIAFLPSRMKGRRGTTRWCPVTETLCWRLLLIARQGLHFRRSGYPNAI